MATVVKNDQKKLALKRVGPSSYGLQLRHDGEIIDLRVFGTYVSGTDTNSTVHNAWVWTAQINGKTLDAPETLLRKRDAVELLINELEKRGVQDLKPATAANASATATVAEELKQKADTTHPMFQPKTAVGVPEETTVDPIMRTTVRIKGTTLVGVVIAKTTGTKQERLRLEFPEGYKAWALRTVVEDVSL